MNDARPLLMIPGPIEISDTVADAAGIRPPSHVAPSFIEAFGEALEALREVWCAGPDSQPFVVAGGGTLAMEAAATNLLDPGERAVVVNTGYFGDRMLEMLRRRGVQTVDVSAPLGDAPSLDAVREALAAAPAKVLFATHVDTSTGVRVDAAALAALAREHGALSCFDGVCATAGETFLQADWGADVYLTASQKAVGLPAGLALWVASPAAMKARAGLHAPPSMSLDWSVWEPIQAAYEARSPSYFSTPATTLVWALRAGLREILDRADSPRAAMLQRFAEHDRAARAMRAAWAVLGLKPLPVRDDLQANTLSALWYPEGVDKGVLGRIKAHGAIVAGGLHPAAKTRYFRVGHMGEVTRRPSDLIRTVRAVAQGLADVGHAADVEAACDAAREVLSEADAG